MSGLQLNSPPKEGPRKIHIETQPTLSDIETQSQSVLRILTSTPILNLPTRGSAFGKRTSKQKSISKNSFSSPFRSKRKLFKRPGQQKINAIMELESNDGSSVSLSILEGAFHHSFLRRSIMKSGDLVYIHNSSLTKQLDEFCDVDNMSNPVDPIIVFGESGIGKSTLLADWLIHRKSMQQNLQSTYPEFVFYHVVGCSRQSCFVPNLLQRILTDLKEYFELKKEIPEAEERLGWQFPKFLESAAKKGRVIIIIDGLQRLRTTDGESILKWVPLSFPPNVRMIFSSATISPDSRQPRPMSTAAHNLSDLSTKTNLLMIERIKVAAARRKWTAIALSPLNKADRERIVKRVTQKQCPGKEQTKQEILMPLDKPHSDRQAADLASTHIKPIGHMSFTLELFELQKNAIVSVIASEIPQYLQFLLDCVIWAGMEGFNMHALLKSWLLAKNVSQLMEQVLSAIETGYEPTEVSTEEAMYFARENVKVNLTDVEESAGPFKQGDSSEDEIELPLGIDNNSFPIPERTEKSIHTNEFPIRNEIKLENSKYIADESNNIKQNSSFNDTIVQLSTTCGLVSNDKVHDELPIYHRGGKFVRPLIELIGPTLCLLYVARHGLLMVELRLILQALIHDHRARRKGRKNAEVFDSTFINSAKVGENKTMIILDEDWQRLLSALRALGMLFIQDAIAFPICHESLRDVVWWRYIGSETQEQCYHAWLIRYFQAQPTSFRRVEELPWHLKRCYSWEALRSTVTDLTMFQLFFTTNYKSELLRYWRILAHGPLLIYEDEKSDHVRADYGKQQTYLAPSEQSPHNVSQHKRAYIQPFDVVREYSKSLDEWRKVSQPPMHTFKPMLLLLTKFMYEFSISYIHTLPDFYHAPIDMKELYQDGFLFAESLPHVQSQSLNVSGPIFPSPLSPAKTSYMTTNVIDNGGTDDSSLTKMSPSAIITALSALPGLNGCKVGEKGAKSSEISLTDSISRKTYENKQQAETHIDTMTTHQRNSETDNRTTLVPDNTEQDTSSISSVQHSSPKKNIEHNSTDLSIPNNIIIRGHMSNTISSSLFYYQRWVWIQFPWLALTRDIVQQIQPSEVSFGSLSLINFANEKIDELFTQNFDSGNPSNAENRGLDARGNNKRSEELNSGPGLPRSQKIKKTLIAILDKYGDTSDQFWNLYKSPSPKVKSYPKELASLQQEAYLDKNRKSLSVTKMKSTANSTLLQSASQGLIETRTEEVISSTHIYKKKSNQATLNSICSSSIKNFPTALSVCSSPSNPVLPRQILPSLTNDSKRTATSLGAGHFTFITETTPSEDNTSLKSHEHSCRINLESPNSQRTISINPVMQQSISKIHNASLSHREDVAVPNTNRKSIGNPEGNNTNISETLPQTLLTRTPGPENVHPEWELKTSYNYQVLLKLQKLYDRLREDSQKKRERLKRLEMQSKEYQEKYDSAIYDHELIKQAMDELVTRMKRSEEISKSLDKREKINKKLLARGCEIFPAYDSIYFDRAKKELELVQLQLHDLKDEKKALATKKKHLQNIEIPALEKAVANNKHLVKEVVDRLVDAQLKIIQNGNLTSQLHRRRLETIGNLQRNTLNKIADSSGLLIGNNEPKSSDCPGSPIVSTAAKQLNIMTENLLQSTGFAKLEHLLESLTNKVEINKSFDDQAKVYKSRLSQIKLQQSRLASQLKQLQDMNAEVTKGDTRGLEDSLRIAEADLARAERVQSHLLTMSKDMIAGASHVIQLMGITSASRPLENVIPAIDLWPPPPATDHSQSFISAFEKLPASDINNLIMICQDRAHAMLNAIEGRGHDNPDIKYTLMPPEHNKLSPHDEEVFQIGTNHHIRHPKGRRRSIVDLVPELKNRRASMTSKSIHEESQQLMNLQEEKSAIGTQKTDDNSVPEEIDESAFKLEIRANIKASSGKINRPSH